MNHSTSSQFAGDTCLLYAQNKIKSLETNLNYDLKRLNEWLMANPLSLSMLWRMVLLFIQVYNISLTGIVVRKMVLFFIQVYNISLTGIVVGRMVLFIQVYHISLSAIVLRRIVVFCLFRSTMYPLLV